MNTNKKFVVDIDLDDSAYRKKLEQLIADTNGKNTSLGAGQAGMGANLSSTDRLAVERMRAEEARKRFAEQGWTQRDIQLANERIAADKAALAGGANPLTYQPQARKEDYYVSAQSKKLEDLNKNFEEATKLNRYINFETRSRHQEYRTLTTSQLEDNRRRLRKEMEKDERAGRFETADTKQAEIEAISQVISRRKSTETSPEERAIRQLGTTLFLGKTLHTLAAAGGQGFQDVIGGFETGTNAYGAMRMSGAGAGKSTAVAGTAMLFDYLLKSFTREVTNTEAFYKLRGSVGTTLTPSNASEEFGKSAKMFADVGINMNDMTQSMLAFVKQTGYGAGGDYGKLSRFVYGQQLMKSTMGLEDSDINSFNRYGRGENRMDSYSAIKAYTKMLSSQGVAGVTLNKEGVGRDLSMLPEYLKQLVDINEQIYKATGDRTLENQKRAIEWSSALTNLGGIFENPDTAVKLSGAIRSSWANPSSPLQQYNQLMAYRSVNPNTTLTDMMLGMSDMTDVNAINAKFSMLKTQLGFGGQTAFNKNVTPFGAEDFRRYQFLQNVAADFPGLAPKELNALADIMMKGGLKQTDLSKFLPGTTEAATDTAYAKTLRTPLQLADKAIQEFLKTNMFDLIKEINAASTSTNSWAKEIGNVNAIMKLKGESAVPENKIIPGTGTVLRLN